MFGPCRVGPFRVTAAPARDRSSEARADGLLRPIGRVPSKASLDLSGLNLTDAQLNLLLTVDPAIWTKEAALIPEFYERFGEHTPKALWDEYEALVARLQEASRPASVVAAE